MAMTLEQLESLPGEFIPVKLAAEYLQSGEQHVRCAMRKGVPWGYVMNKADFRIPKRRFVSYHKEALIARSEVAACIS
jgi:hypothetical protein